METMLRLPYERCANGLRRGDEAGWRRGGVGWGGVGRQCGVVMTLRVSRSGQTYQCVNGGGSGWCVCVCVSARRAADGTCHYQAHTSLAQAVLTLSPRGERAGRG